MLSGVLGVRRSTRPATRELSDTPPAQRAPRQRARTHRLPAHVPCCPQVMCLLRLGANPSTTSNCGLEPVLLGLGLVHAVVLLLGCVATRPPVLRRGEHAKALVAGMLPGAAFPRGALSQAPLTLVSGLTSPSLARSAAPLRHAQILTGRRHVDGVGDGAAYVQARAQGGDTAAAAWQLGHAVRAHPVQHTRRVSLCRKAATVGASCLEVLRAGCLLEWGARGGYSMMTRVRAPPCRRPKIPVHAVDWSLTTQFSTPLLAAVHDGGGQLLMCQLPGRQRKDEVRRQACEALPSSAVWRGSRAPMRPPGGTPIALSPRVR